MDPMQLPDDRHDLSFRKAISRWDEALPLGNGLTGCLVYGDGAPLRMALNRGDLWDTRVAPETEAPDYTYANLIELVKNKDQASILKRYDDFYLRTTPTKIPVGRLLLDYGLPADRVTSRLSLRTAEAKIELQYGDTLAVVRTFLHAERQVGFGIIEGTAELPSLMIEPPDYSGSKNNDQEEGMAVFENWKVSSLGYPPPELGSDGDKLIWYRQRSCESLEFAIVVATGPHSGGGLAFAYAVISNQDGPEWFEAGKQRVLEAVEEGYAAAMESHKIWWDGYWGQSSVTLPDAALEKQYYVTNYLFASCSRKGAPPMPLQGVWSADEGLLPPWKGDYHHDLNTQMSYWHYLKANRLQEGESFVDFLWELMPAGREFASRFFDAPGICLPAVMAIDGKSLGGWPMYGTNLVNQIWLCQAFDHYWLYSGDEDFLRDKAYVYFKETAECILRWLKPDQGGKLLLPLSSSPEFHNNSIEAWLTPNSNNDLALLIYLFDRLSVMADRLGIFEDVVRWCKVRGQLPNFALDANGALMISPDESLTESHRHMSHLMAVYPLKLLDYERTESHKRTIDASMKQLETLGKGMWKGYSYAWVSSLYAQQGNGEAASYHLRMFLDGYVSPNGFHLCGDYKNLGLSAFKFRPFTLEGNMGYADALQEMLLQNRHGELVLFPAIPSSWREQGVGFQSLRAEGGVLVSATCEDEALAFVKLKAERKTTVRLRNSFACDRLLMKEESGSIHHLDCLAGAVLVIQLDAGREVTLTVAPASQAVASEVGR